ncbi:MAG TPA: hypothetical protein PLC39_00010 [Methanomassiliicoccales archaeon]|nr:hypothetical protein [Methanomassiliicoccales archaeon]HPR97675.1 hypothetical protein [Methanomassiliicoccales archaeon]
MAANKGTSYCSKCGKPFVGLMIVKAIAAIYAIYFFALFFFNLLVMGDDWMLAQLSFLEPFFPFGDEYIAISIVLLIIGLPIIMAGIYPGVEKMYKGNGASACKDCRALIAREQADAAEMARAKQEAQAYAYMAKVDGLEKGDAWIGKLIRSWKLDNPNKIPEECMLDDLVMAHNMERAGNYEKAAVILEKYLFWEEAGRVRRLDDQKIIKHITVDMNALINQVGNKGLAIPYKCSSCGASITIDKDSKQDGLKFCSYCGTAYNVEDMTKIIQLALE